jgi:peptide/nickel transport system substrate-binding protein
MTLKQPDGEILPKLSLFSFAIVSPTAVKKDPENFFKNPVGTGPFIFKEWVQGDHVTVAKNPNYWGGAPKIDGIIYKVIPDNSARAAEMQAGTIDVGEIAAVDVPNLQKSPDINVTLQPAVSVGYLAFNPSASPVFKDLKVRQAFAHAINRKAIIDAFYGDLGQVPTQFQPPAILGYNKDLQYYDYNPDTAKQLLQQAGVTNLKTDFWYMSVTRGYFPDPKSIAEAIARDLSAVGITVNLQTKDWGAYLDDRTKGKLGLYMLGWGSDNGDPDNFIGYFFKANKPEFSYDNADLRDTLTKAGELIDPAQRDPLYQKAQKLVNDGVPCIPMAWARGAVVSRKRLQNYNAPLFAQGEFREVTLAQ